MVLTALKASFRFGSGNENTGEIISSVLFLKIMSERYHSTKCLTNALPPLFFAPVIGEAIPSNQALICSLHLTSNVTHLSPSYSSSLCAFTPRSLHHCIHSSLLLSLCSKALPSHHPSHSMCSDSSVIRWQQQQ